MARRRRARGGGETNVWELADKLVKCPTTKNAVPNLPDNCTSEQAKGYFGRLCLLLRDDPPDDAEQRFQPRYHMFAQVCAFSEESGFHIRPINSFGECEGNALAEKACNVFLLPSPGCDVTLGEDAESYTLGEYILPNASVALTRHTAPNAQQTVNAVNGKPRKKRGKKEKSEKKKGRKRKNTTKEKVKNTKTKKAKVRKNKNSRTVNKKTTNKRAFDKGSSSTANDTGDATEARTVYTLEKVLQSFANPRGTTCIHAYANAQMICSHYAHR